MQLDPACTPTSECPGRRQQQPGILEPCDHGNACANLIDRISVQYLRLDHAAPDVSDMISTCPRSSEYSRHNGDSTRSRSMFGVTSVAQERCMTSAPVSPVVLQLNSATSGHATQPLAQQHPHFSSNRDGTRNQTIENGCQHHGTIQLVATPRVTRSADADRLLCPPPPRLQ